jgi:putative spermidine/putrescine transport system substrate-binding protein/spermidine/putrescine transport system substrate-binding protein
MDRDRPHTTEEAMTQHRQFLTRRDFGRVAAATATVTVAAPRLARAAGELRIFTWEGYADKPWVEAFEAATGAKVAVSYTGSVDEMFARMQGSSGADFDVLAFDTGSFQRYVDQGLIQPLDPAKLPNRARLAPAFQEVPEIVFDGRLMGVPFAWGSLPLVYDKAQFPDGPPDSWGVLWDPANAQQIISLDDANNCIVNTAIYLGFDNPYNLTDEQFETVKQKLIDQKKLMLTYFAGFDEGANIFVENNIKAMFAMGETQYTMVKSKGVDAGMVIPKEGAIGWLDCWVISKGCRDLDLAHAWIDAQTTPEVGEHISRVYSYGNTTNVALNEELGLTYADKLVWLQPPEDFEKRTRIWNEVKAAPI